VPINDHHLLRQHLLDPSDSALVTLINRHLPLVHSVARRVTANNEAARDHILSEITESWARHSPKEALAWTTKLDSDEKSHTTAVALKSWSETDPAKATNWVASKSQSPERNSALGKTLWNWTTQNPAAATAWVQSQPDGPAKDQALAGLAIAAVEFDPHTALEWAQKISESSFRDELTRRTFTTVIPKPPTNGGKENNFKSDD
jgi:hypothetical protein